MLANDNESLKVLFNLNGTTASETSKCKESTTNVNDDNCHPLYSATESSDVHVLDVFDIFSDVVDTKILKQPFSVRKYKHLIPRSKTRRKSSKEQQSPLKKKSSNQKNERSSKEILDFGPCSPTLSVDSAIDVSADSFTPDFVINVRDENRKKYGHFFPEKYNNCIDVISKSNTQTTKKDNENNDNDQTTKERHNYCSKYFVKKSVVEEDDLIQVVKKSHKIDDHFNPQSLFDILNSNIEKPIPIQLVKDASKNYGNQTQIYDIISVEEKEEPEDNPKVFIPFNIDFETIKKLTTTDTLISPLFNFNIDDEIPIVEQSQMNKSYERKNDNFTDTLLNLLKETDEVPLDKPSEDVNSKGTITHPFIEHKEMEHFPLPDGFAVRSLQFIVDNDDYLPDNLIRELYNSSKHITDTEGGALSSSFNLNILRMYCKGVLESDQTHNKIDNRKKKCALKVSNKYKMIRMKNCKKDKVFNHVEPQFLSQRLLMKDLKEPSIKRRFRYTRIGCHLPYKSNRV